MRVLTVLFDEENKYENEKAFDGLSAKDLTVSFFEKADFLPETVENCGVKVITKKDCGTTELLFSKLTELSSEAGADFIIYSYADLPFINSKITKKLIETHLEYKCEYTFADGYAYGFMPEVLDCGACRILSQLSKTTQAAEGEKTVCRQSIFNLIKTDINSFEVETEISDEDWRLLRFNFCCQNKDSFLQCCELYKIRNSAEENSNSLNLCDFDAEKLCEAASKNHEVLKTVPGFYEIQISDFSDVKPLYSPYEAVFEKEKGIPAENAKSFMKYSEFESLISKIADFSENAVVSLSAFGEAFANPEIIKIIEKTLSYSGLSVFIETSGLMISEEICQKLKEIVTAAQERTNGWQKIMISVRLDSFSEQIYEKMNGVQGGFTKAAAAVVQLASVLPGCVYPQFTRTTENEPELEAFFRYWNEKTNPSGGNLIIQKYSNYAGLLPDRKSADLSPIDRNVCWHLRRDFIILSDGTVTLCRACVLGKNGDFGKSAAVCGNAFTDSLEEIWKKRNLLLDEHINNNYCESCGNCDDFYTFNF